MRPTLTLAARACRAQAAALDAAEVLIDLRSDSALHWLNNLEAGRQYWAWSTRLTDLLRPQFTGQLHQIARNLYSLVALVDPGRADSLELLALLRQVAGSQWPVRVGALLLPGETLAAVRAGGEAAAAATPWADAGAGERAARAFLALETASGPLAAWQFLAQLAPRGAAATAGGSAGPSPAAVAAAVAAAWAELPAGRARGLSGEAALAQLETGEGVGAGVAAEAAAAAAFGVARGVADSAPALWLNGALTPRPPGVRWQQLLGFAVQVEQQRLQEAVYYGRLTDEHADILGRVLALGRAVGRHRPRLLAPAAPRRAAADPAAPYQVALTGPLSPRGAPWAGLGYLHCPGSEDVAKGVTHWLVADFGGPAGRELLAAGLGYLADEAAEGARLALAHSPGPGAGAPAPWVRGALAAARLPARRAKVPGFLRGLLERFPAGEASEEDVLAEADAAGLNTAALAALLADADGAGAAAAAAVAAACRARLGVPAGGAAVVTNGRVVLLRDGVGSGGVADGAAAEDLALLQMVAESSQLSSQVGAAPGLRRVGCSRVATTRSRWPHSCPAAPVLLPQCL